MIDAPELLQYLQKEEKQAVDQTLNDERATALSFYRGELFGDEVDGRSKLVTRDVAEVVDYMTVSIMRTFVSGDKLVEFEPVEPVFVDGPVDPQTRRPTQKDISQDLADEASERIHWNFLREQDGYSILHDGIKAGLLEKSGIWKSWVERKFRYDQQRLNATEVDALGDAVATGQEAQYEDEEGNLVPLFDLDEFGQPLQVYDVRVKSPMPPVFRDGAVPNEQFFYSPDTRTLDTSPYLGDWSRQSIHDLFAMGYALADLENLYGDQPGDSQALSTARDADRSWKEEDAQRVEWNRVVVLREEYCWWFWEGIYQRIKIHRVGVTILGVEAVEDQPYTLWCPFPMQHRLVGDSLADKVLDIQVVRSHMLRQAMDNLYLSNAPRVSLAEGSISDTTIDDLLDVAPGGIIRHRGEAPKPWEVPFVAGNAFTAMEIMSGEKESRTGITRLNQGLDADTLNKTATGTALMQASGQQIEEYCDRNAANAIAEMFEKKARLMMAHMEPHQFKVDGEVRDVDPAQWPANMRFTVRVGLGTGNKDKRLQQINLLAQGMDDLRGIDPRMVTPEHAFNAFKLLAGQLQVGPVTQFCADPANLPPQPPQPDPETVKAEAKAKEQQEDLAFKQQKTMMETEARRAKDVADAELAWEKMDRETRLAIMKIMRGADDNFSPGGSLAQ